MNVIKNINKYLEEGMCVILLATMTILIFLQIIFRFCNLPLSWTEELARYLFVWLIYIGCALGVKKRKHVKVDAVMLLCKEKGKFNLSVISNVLFMIFCIIISFSGVKLIYTIYFVYGQTSPALNLPMAIPYSSFVVGCIIMIIRLVQDTILLFKERNIVISNGKNANVISEEGK